MSLDERAIQYLKEQAINYALGRIDAFGKRDTLWELVLMFSEYPPVTNRIGTNVGWDINDLWNAYVSELNDLKED